jgi:hypothetical protein
MKQAEIKVGDVVRTKVGQSLVKVQVTGRLEANDFRKTVRFTVSRIDNGRPLPKSRTAAALRAIKSTETVPVTQIVVSHDPMGLFSKS